MTDRPGLDFSFSGLKNSAANTINQAIKQEGELTWTNQKRISPLPFQDSVVDTLAIKCKRALKETGYKRLVIAGGVSANKKITWNPWHNDEKSWWWSILSATSILYR